MNAAAEREWIAVAPDGSEHPVVLRVETPYCEKEGLWLATASLDGLDTKRYPIAGVDAWQATNLAMAFIAGCIERFSRRGWTFRWGAGDSIVTSANLKGWQ